MRWRLTILLTLCVVLLLPQGAQGHSMWKHPKIRACMQWDWRKGTYQTARMIRCYARVMNAPGSPSFVLCVARRESGLDPGATSPSGTYRGLFQHSRYYWPSRYAAWGKPSHLYSSVYNGRTNTVVSIRMAKSQGGWYSDWSSADNCD